MNATHSLSSIVESDREDLIAVGHSEAELCEIGSFLEPLYLTARLYAVRIFIKAKLRKKPFEEVVAVMQRLWEETWKQGTSSRLGDPDDVAPGGVGMNNTCAFFEAYKLLGLPKPKFLF